MLILHLTDLHVGSKERGLIEHWDGLRSALPPEQQKFDFVVVSGDLTDTADPKEYLRLRKLLEKLSQSLVKPDPARVILVPGNHDVSWSHRKQYAKPIRGSEPDPEDLKEIYIANRFRVEKRDSRPDIVRAIDPEEFSRRFLACQGALNTFYKKSLNSPHRAGVFTDPDPAKQWSAHIFRDEGVAFFGFNSAISTDYFWRGAYISPQSVSAARAYAEEHAKGLLKVAVWHHGLVGPKGADDFVSLAELGELANAGFDLGIHGHTHRDELIESIELPRLPIIATGSFTAIQDHRPDGIKNQASVVDLTPTYLRWRVYEREANSSKWSAEPLIREVQVRRPIRTSQTPIAKLGAHERCVEIDADGIATVRVRINRLELTSDLVLARPRSSGRIDWSQTAVGTLLTSTGEGGSRVPLKVELTSENEVILRKTGGRYSDIEWSYAISNSFALDDVDLELGPYLDGEDRAELLPGQDAIVHTVRAHTDSLALKITAPTAKTVWIAQLRVQIKTETGWVDQPDDARAAVVKASREGVVATVRHPRLGARYILAYQTPRRRKMPDSAVDALLRETTRLVRDHRRRENPMNEAIEEAIRGFREEAEGTPVGSWVLYLWSSEHRRLVTCAGRFPPRSWGAAFAYGAGVAGHAFRTVRPAVFSTVAGSTTGVRNARLIYQPATANGALQEHKWLVCVPIVHEPDSETAIGVVGFADYQEREESAFSGWLRESAQLISATDGPIGQEHRSSLGGLSHTLSATFWQTLGHMDSLSDGFRRLAATIHATSWLPAGL